MSRNIAIVSNVNMPEGPLSHFEDEFEQIASGLLLHEPTWKFTRYRPYLGEYPQDLNAYDGVVFSGSPSSVNEPEPWISEMLELIRTLHKMKKPMAGICFGHQAIAKALGGHVGINPDGWSIGAVPVDWKTHSSWMQPAKRDLRLYAIHNEQVLELPDGAEMTATAQGCPFAGFRIGTHVMTTQHHPEMPKEFVGAVLEWLKAPLEHGPDVKSLIRADESLKQEVDGALMMGWITQFLSQGK
ncbi:type 1 glutamine amidotransferase [Granulosicoccus antarcticus]|uniref:GMP synthase (Glutamine-hydrolyzing) n=1 Tax=Granulosicoccus antarcticus IMCC3135 TaxID=1192854 RepID=A0A2Z2NT66_9GAMM|nr:type 1 glutamine amidotransferase [Granulosicoccus antarcticus]ASJ70304.1 GMP synthase (glutamine-hydrolyzing) [Granulosicoccus antarcticus IMCC3135]